MLYSDHDQTSETVHVHRSGIYTHVHTQHTHTVHTHLKQLEYRGFPLNIGSLSVRRGLLQRWITWILSSTKGGTPGLENGNTIIKENKMKKNFELLEIEIWNIICVWNLPIRITPGSAARARADILVDIYKYFSYLFGSCLPEKSQLTVSKLVWGWVWLMLLLLLRKK